jgi:glyoxylase-like metal-dependent hydrolase (beta-lactamase superfamily II)
LTYHQLRIPLPFAMDPLNAWLVDSGDGWVLIDSGMHTNAGRRALDRAVADTGVPWSDVRTVIFTHMHPDHVGLAPYVKQASGAIAGMHALDADLLREFAKPETAPHWNGVAMDLAGSPAELKGPVNAAFQLLTVKFPELELELDLKGGERLGGLEVLWAPGHSPGHICLIDREKKMLFSGDHILETASPNIGWLPEGDPLLDYLASLRCIAPMDIDLVLPGHGEPMRTHREWIDGAVAHHLERLEKIQDMIRQRPHTAHEISLGLWKRELEPIHYRFAIFEVLAHLVYLENQGAVRHEGAAWF